MIICEVNIRQYTPEGSFNAFAEKLPRLAEMGVECIWLMPIHPIGQVKRKGSLGSYYSISDHRAVNPAFGTEQDLHALISNAHACGIKVILDWVANHTAWDHVWTKTNPDFLQRDAEGNFLTPPGWDDVLQIDHGSRGAQLAMQEAMQYWIREFDIDGFRADLAHLTPLAFWKEARMKCDALKKDLVWLMESEEMSYFDVFDIGFTWEWMHACEVFSLRSKGLDAKTPRREETPREIQDALSTLSQALKKTVAATPRGKQRLWFTTNHDENSWNGTEYEKFGNNALAFAVLSALLPGSTLIYSGQDMPLKHRLKFFDKDLIPQGEPTLASFYKTLYDLRKSQPQLFGADVAVHLHEDALRSGLFCFGMQERGEAVVVLLNLTDDVIEKELVDEKLSAGMKELFSGEILNADHVVKARVCAGGYKVYAPHLRNLSPASSPHPPTASP